MMKPEGNGQRHTNSFRLKGGHRLSVSADGSYGSREIKIASVEVLPRDMTSVLKSDEMSK